jgi:hypothetical protein
MTLFGGFLCIRILLRLSVRRCAYVTGMSSKGVPSKISCHIWWNFAPNWASDGVYVKWTRTSLLKSIPLFGFLLHCGSGQQLRPSNTVPYTVVYRSLRDLNWPFGSDLITTVFLSYHIRLVAVVNDLKMEYPIVYGCVWLTWGSRDFSRNALCSSPNSNSGPFFPVRVL